MSRTPFVPLSAALAAGILIGRTGAYAPTALCCTLAGIAALLALAAVDLASRRRPVPLRRKTIALSFRLRNAIWVPASLLICAFGTMLLRATYSDPDIYFANHGRHASGIIREITRGSEGDRAVITVDSYIERDGGSHGIHSFRTLLSAPVIPGNPGDRVIFPGYFEETSSGGNTENFDYKEYLYTRGIDHAASPVRIVVAGSGDRLWSVVTRCRDACITAIEKTPWHKDTKAFVCAILLGERSMLSEQTRDNYTGSGLAHILAVSGLHVGIITILAGLLFKPLDLAGSRTPRRIATICAIILYALATGLEPSVARASVMAVAAMTAALLQRPHSNINALAAAAFAILACDPRALFDLGFQLSFATTLGVIAVMPLVRQRSGSNIMSKAVSAAILPVAAFLVSWPLTAGAFHEISLLFLPLNIVALPLLPGFFLSVACYLCLHAAGIHCDWLGTAIDTARHWLDTSAALISASGASHIDIRLSEASLWLYMAGVTTGICLLYRYSRLTFRLSAAMLGAAVLTAAFTSPDMPPDGYIVTTDHLQCGINSYSGGREERLSSPAGSIELRQTGPDLVVWIDRKTGEASFSKPFPCATLIIGSGYRGEIRQLLQHFAPQRIVLHTSIEPEVAADYAAESDILGIPCHNTATDGPYRRYFD